MAIPVALVTGASAGLGEEFARQLSARGHRLVLAARRKDRLDALAAQLGNARAVEMDLSRPGAAAELMIDITSAGETVELLVNNAGFGLHGRFDKADPDRLRQMVDLNCGALTDLGRAVLPAMIERRSGGILNLASTAAFQAGPGMAVYFATKAYVLSLSEALHEEVRRFGVKVSALCPGPTRTEFGEVAGFTNGGAFDRISMDSATVVREGLEALERNKAVAITGRLNKLGAFSTRLVPRALVRKIAGAMKF
ncbi:MAG TPA: SDR family oxidoreductase [Sphingomicrobium sp.]|nr:SDR family oxidoreductase [Sphingomicrobium sp.]